MDFIFARPASGEASMDFIYAGGDKYGFYFDGAGHRGDKH